MYLLVKKKYFKTTLITNKTFISFYEISINNYEIIQSSETKIIPPLSYILNVPYLFPTRPSKSPSIVSFSS